MPAVHATLAGFLLVLFRTAGLLAVAPLFGIRAVPARARMGLALMLALVAFVGAGAPAFPAWNQTATLVHAVVSETLMGLAAGLGARFVVEAAASAGHTIGLSAGLGFGAVIDPLHGAESTALSQLLAFLALGVAVAAGIHREAIAWLCRSVVENPPASVSSIPELAANIVGSAAEAAALAVRLAVPVMAAITFGHMALGVISRAVPQLGLANVGFSVAILAGGGALYLVVPTLAQVTAQAARAAFVGH